MTDPKTRILDAARRHFAGQGFSEASMQAIRREAGVSNGSLFHFFPSKQALGASVYLGAIRDYQAAVLAALASSQDLDSGVAAFIDAHLDWTVSNRDAARFLAEVSHTGWSPEVVADIRAANEHMLGGMDAWWRAHGSGALPLEVAVATLMGPAQMICRAWLTGALDASPLEFRAGLVATARRALGTPPGS